MRLSVRSLRARLAIPTFCTLLLAITAVLALAMETEVTTMTAVPGSFHLDVTEEVVLSPWTAPLALLLAIPAFAGSWWWAGRVVRPIRRIAELTEEVQLGVLARRIEVGDAATEVQMLAGSFNRMLDRLRAESGIQRQLLENTSHEIRTPLAVLATNVDVMLADPEPTLVGYRASTELAARTVHRMRATVDALLTQARLDNYAIAQSDNDLGEIVTTVLEDCEDVAAAANVRLERVGPPRLLCALGGFSVARAVGNLIENAVRHSPDGGVVLVELSSRPDRAYVSVTDQGPGVRDEDREHMFERFWTRGPSVSEGAGIGLSIVKQVADAHRGISVESPVDADGGTRFTLWFDRQHGAGSTTRDVDDTALRARYPR